MASRVQKRVRSSPPLSRPAPNPVAPYRELLQECKAELEFRIPNHDYRLGILRKNVEVLPDLARTIASIEWEKATLLARLERINAVLDAK